MTLLRGSRGSPATGTGNSSCLPSGTREAPGQAPGAGDRPACSPSGGDKGQEGTATGLPHCSHVPLCLSLTRFPPGPLWVDDSRGAPALQPVAGGMPSGRQFPDSMVPGGTSTKTARSGLSPRRAVSSGRGRELSAVSINSPKQPCVRGGGGWAGGTPSQCFQLGWRRLAALRNHPEGAQAFPRQTFQAAKFCLGKKKSRKKPCCLPFPS